MASTELFDLELEIKALKTVLSTGDYAAKMFMSLGQEHFYYKVTKSLFIRIEDVAGKSTEFPSWRVLLQDSKLEEGTQAALQDSFQNSVEASCNADVDYIVKGLTQLSNKRKLFNKLAEATQGLREEGKSVEEIAGDFTDTLNSLDSEDEIPEICFGAGYNLMCEQVFNDLVYGTGGGGAAIPTGFKSFDERSGGHQRGNLVVWGANSGGGKSVMALNLMVRQYLMGYNVVLASYEMNFHEITTRLFSIISEVPMEAITTRRLTVEQKFKIDCAHREFVLFGIKNGNAFKLACPTGETTVQKVAAKYKSFKPDAIIFDYINLLTTKAKHAEAQWQALGEIAKEAKILATQYNCVVHLLTQIDKDHNLRYSQAIKDHANWVTGWVYDDDARANGFVTVKQMKARNAPQYDFQLITRFDISQFRDPDQEDENKNYTKAQFDEIQDESRRLGALLELPIIEAPSPVAVLEEKKSTEKPRSLLGAYEEVI